MPSSEMKLVTDGGRGYRFGKKGLQMGEEGTDLRRGYRWGKGYRCGAYIYLILQSILKQLL